MEALRDFVRLWETWGKLLKITETGGDFGGLVESWEEFGRLGEI